MVESPLLQLRPGDQVYFAASSQSAHKTPSTVLRVVHGVEHVRVLLEGPGDPSATYEFIDAVEDGIRVIYHRPRDHSTLSRGRLKWFDLHVDLEAEADDG